MAISFFAKAYQSLVNGELNVSSVKKYVNYGKQELNRFLEIS